MCINNEWVHTKPEDWKDVYTAALMDERRIASGIDGKRILLGLRTSRMNKAAFSDLIELIYAHGSEHGVEWSEPALEAYEQYAAQVDSTK